MINYKFNIIIWQSVLLVLLCSCGPQNNNIITPCEKVIDNWLIEFSINPSEFNQYDIFFPNKLVGYTVGKAGSILKSINSGMDWEVIHDRNFTNHVTELKLTKVYFLNENIGYVGGERMDVGIGEELLKGAALLKTIDGGGNWTKKYFSNIREFDDFIFFDQLHGIALASFETDSTNLTRKLLNTIDGGETWIESPISDMEINSRKFELSESCLFFLAKDISNEAIIVISSDRGLNWNKKPLPEQNCNRIIFVNDSIGYLICGSILSPERVYRTEDQGDLWTIELQSPINSYSVAHFISENTGLVINTIYILKPLGGEFYQELDSFEFFETTDGGKSWTKSMVDKSCGFEGIGYDLDETIFYIMGDSFCRLELK